MDVAELIDEVIGREGGIPITRRTGADQRAGV
jgi:hypothetical protein